MVQRKKLCLVIVAAVMVLVVLSVLMVAAGAQESENENQQQGEAVTDSVEFEAEFRAAEKLPEVVGQYAWTSINGQVVESAYSTEPRPMETGSVGLAGDACAYGGAGEGCLGGGGAASASTENGNMEVLDEDFVGLLGIGLATTGAEVTEAFTTGVRCSVDENGSPGGVAQIPAGAVMYGSPDLLSLQRRTVEVETLPDGEMWSDYWQVGALLGLLGLLSGTTVEVEITPNSGWSEESLRAHSELTVRYRGRNGGDVRPWITFTARSECGMLMSDGTGSTGPAGVSVQSLADPEAPGTADSLVQPTSAPGAPQATGFTDESSLTTGDGVDYHLLSTRELRLLDREHILEALAATRETGAVEGATSVARWWLYSAEATGEQVPVLEIELADATVVQVRPKLPGVHPPAPDAVPSETPSNTTQSTTTEQLPEPTTQPPAEPTPEPIPTTSEESGQGAENG